MTGASDARARLGLTLASGLALVWWSPPTAACFAISILAGWVLEGAGTPGHLAFLVVHGALMVLARELGTLPVLGLAALGLQQLAWRLRPLQASWLDRLFTFLFLPRALAGPVWTVLPRRRAAPDPSGWGLVLLGLVEKVVIADSFAWHADAVLDGHGSPGALQAWSGLVAFAVQALFDLAGLWHVAQGLGRVVGFPLPDGPRHPFAARTLADFWGRWHPSLAGVLREAHVVTGSLGVYALAVLFYGTHPMAVLAVAVQLGLLGLERVSPVHPGRAAVWLAGLHGLLLFRSPSLERVAFLQDGLVGVFGPGTADPASLLALVGGVMVLAFGPPDPVRVFPVRSRPLSAPLAVGTGLAVLVLWLAQARPFLYPRL
ncbi:MAG: hypothetical protein R3F61_15650 [Myxococcota bacterium]